MCVCAQRNEVTFPKTCVVCRSKTLKNANMLATLASMFLYVAHSRTLEFFVHTHVVRAVCADMSQNMGESQNLAELKRKNKYRVFASQVNGVTALCSGC